MADATSESIDVDRTITTNYEYRQRSRIKFNIYAPVKISERQV